MRLFTGISLDPRVLARLEEALAPLRTNVPVAWSPAENLHVTSKFIGEWPEARLPELTSTLQNVESPGPIGIDISKFGFFPNPHQPRFFFAGVHAGPGLADLAARTDAALEPLGCPRETRPYTPHLTLARIRDQDRPENLRTLREHIANMTNFNFGTFVAQHFHLYLSKPGPNGSVYTMLASFPL
jgi:2'-5' RNA ligase